MPDTSPKVLVNGERRTTDVVWSGLDIAHWFFEEHVKKGKGMFQGADGIDLPGCEASEFTNYSYIWVTAAVDLDMSAFWLIDVRTQPEDGSGETRDFLFVASPADRPGIECEWLNKPRRYGSGIDSAQDHLATALDWFSNLVMNYVRGERL